MLYIIGYLVLSLITIAVLNTVSELAGFLTFYVGQAILLLTMRMPEWYRNHVPGE